MGSRPNIVMITVDSLRADHCGFLGGDRDLTPTIDRLARNGVRFANAIAPGPQTYSSMPAVFTGVRRDPGVVRAKPHDEFWRCRLAAISDHLSWFAPIPQRLRELGYTTAGVSPNPWSSSSAGFDRGFDHFLDLSGSPMNRQRGFLDRVVGFDPVAKPIEHLRMGLSKRAFFSRWDAFYDDLLALHDRLVEPYFLWVFLLDTHFPYVTPAEYRQETGLPAMYYASIRSRGAMRSGGDPPRPHVGSILRRCYRDTVRSVDSFVERFWQDVHEDDPVMFFHSDHGESLGDRGYFGHHHRRLFEENVHVPWFIHDGQTEMTITEPKSLATIPDTVTEVATEGRFVPTLSREFAVASSELGDHRALRGRRVKFVESDGHGPSLFDLATDPDERTNIASRHPDLVRVLQEYLDVHDRRAGEKSKIASAADSIVASAKV